MRILVPRAFAQSSGGSGSGEAGRWRWRGLSNSDGVDDGATDPGAASEPCQIPGVGPGRQAAGLGSVGYSEGSAPGGSDCAAPGPRPPTGIGEGQPSRPRTSRPCAVVRGSPGTGRSLQGVREGRGGRAKARCCHLARTASTAPGLNQNTWAMGTSMTQVQARCALAPLPAPLQWRSGAQGVGSKSGAKGLGPDCYT